MVSVYNSNLPDARDPSGQASGSYFLPKHHVKIDVFPNGESYRLKQSVIAVKDNKAHLQVGFNLSPTSDDNISVTYEKGLLKQISATATDKTSEILVQIAKTIGAFRDAGADQPIASYDFDPFDYFDALRINNIIRSNYPGSCVEVEISPNIWSPGCGAKSLAKGKRSRDAFEAAVKIDVFPSVSPGIYYRRAVTHRVHLVENGRTKEIVSQPFANQSPAFQVDISRTLFVTRETTINFTDGELTSVGVRKDSEALAIAKLPLSIVNAFIAAPVDGLLQRQKVAEARAKLLTEQSNLERARSEYVKAVTARTVATGETRSGIFDQRSTIDFRNSPSNSTRLTSVGADLCRNAGFTDEAECLRYLMQPRNQ